MNKISNLQRKDILLMILPVLLLLAIAAVLNRKKVPSGEFRLKVTEVKFTRLLSPKKHNWRLKVTAYVGHEGKTPGWWGNTIILPCSFTVAKFVDKNGKVYVPNSSASSCGSMDAARQEFVFESIVNVSVDRLRIPSPTFVGVIGMGDVNSNRIIQLPISQSVDDKF